MATYNIDTSSFTPAQVAAVKAAGALAAPGNTVTYTSGGSSGGGSGGSSGGSSSTSASNVNKYNPNTGALLKPGETVTINGTNTTVTEGQVGTGTAPKQDTNPPGVVFSPANGAETPMTAEQIVAQKVAYDASMTKILSNPLLTADQKAHLTEIGGVLSTGDKAKFIQMVNAFTEASKYSDPFFKAQIQLSLDTLKNGFLSQEGDLSFKEGQLSNALNELRANTTASKDQLSFQHAQELKKLADSYTQDLQTTQDNMAASGFTSSTKRARAEDILATNNTGLVESSNKTFGYQTGNLDRTLASSDVNTQAQLANLERLTSEGKLNLLRTAESQVGSTALSDLGYSGLVGNVGGDIPYNQFKDAATAANATLGSNQSYSFVF